MFKNFLCRMTASFCTKSVPNLVERFVLRNSIFKTAAVSLHKFWITQASRICATTTSCDAAGIKFSW